MTDKEVINILSQMIIINDSFIYDDEYKCLNLTQEQMDYISRIIINVAIDEIKKEMNKDLNSGEK